MSEGQTKGDQVRTMLIASNITTKEQLTDELVKNITETIGCSKALIYKVIKKLPPLKEVKLEQEAQIPIITVKKEEEIPPEEIEEEEEEEAELPPSLLEEGKEAIPPLEINAQVIVGYIWKTVNTLLPKENKKTQEEIALLVEVWTPVAEKYGKWILEHFGIEAIAVMVTVMMFAGDIKGGIVSWQKKRKEKEEKTTQKGS